MTTMTESHTRLWDAIANKLAELFPNGNGLNRDAGWFSDDGLLARTTAKRKAADGSWTTYEITAADRQDRIEVTTVEGVDNADWFWQPIADETDRTERVVVDDRCYTIRPDSRNPGSGDGFSGRRFEIEWLDEAGRPTGETVVTRNLWSRGTLPPAWRNELSPNARFVSEV